jgi:hypothetical protein
MNLETGLIKAIEKALGKITVVHVHLKKKGHKTKFILDILRRRTNLTNINKQLRGIDEHKPPLN